MKLRAALLCAAWLCAPTLAQLNDTGQTICTGTDGTVVGCTDVGGIHPGQDARFGRDARAGGAAFDLHPLSGGDCVVDRVTGLSWSTETLSATWADANTAATSYDRCGIDSDWRLPTRRELLSIVHHGANGPAIDAGAFPATQSAPYWSSDAQGGDAWTVDFSDGDTKRIARTETHAARLVARPVNQPPAITLGADIVVPREDRPGPLTYPGWATGISPGPAREAGQHLTATVELLPLLTGDPKALEFEVPPAIDLTTGDLTFTIKHRIDTDPWHPGDPTYDRWVSSAGLARVRVTLQDDGGTAHGGQDSTSAEFTIFLDPAPFVPDTNIYHPWKASCIPVSFIALDVDTDPVISDSWQHGDRWPYPTFEIIGQPQKGYMFVYGSSSADAGTTADDSQPNLLAVMNPSDPDRPSLWRFNWIMIWCYVPFSSTFVGVDVITYRVTDPDGNVSNLGNTVIEIFEN